MSFENFPYSNFHELNLDWILQKLKEAYSAENPPDFPVKSVNGMTGDVIIAIPSNFVQSVNGETGDVVLYRNPLTQFPATDEVRWNLFRICDGTETGIQFDENGASRIEGIRRIRIYDEDNPPDYPVTSVNGQTGDVQITAGVQSVNGKTGNVVTPFVNPNTDILAIDTDSPSVLWGFSRNVAGGNVALYITTGGTNPQAFIRYTPTDGEAINLPLLTNADIPSEAGVVSVNTKTGAVTLYGTDILTTENGNTIAQNINDLINAFNGISTNSKVSTEWQQGYINNSNGTIGSDSHSCVTNFIECDGYEYFLTVGERYGTKVALYNSSKTYVEIISDYSSGNKSFKVEKGNFIKVQVTSPSESLTPSSITDDIIKIDERTYTDKTLTNKNIPADAKATGDAVNSLRNAVNEIDNTITTLQSENNTQNQQITALQNTDATHTQQITALQTAVDNIQSGAGIKEVKLSEVVTLPARYPATGTDTDIKANMTCVNAVLSRPGVQRTNFTVEFFDGYLNISGTMQGLTDIILYLTEV